MKVYVLVDFCGEPTVFTCAESLIYNINSDYFYYGDETNKVYLSEVLKNPQSIKYFINFFETLPSDSRVIFYCDHDGSTRVETLWMFQTEVPLKGEA